MPLLVESSWIWASAATLTFLIVASYATAFGRRNRRDHRRFEEAMRLGLDQPGTRMPVIDPSLCIGCGTCVTACPEGDVLGVVGGTATVVNGLRCIGHGLCEESCPVGALEVVMGDLRQRADVPILDPFGETTVPGVFVAGELSGLALIRNAVEQGRRAIRRIAEQGLGGGEVDVAIVGAGPAGLAAAMTAVEEGLRCRVFEQAESLGGTILHYPAQKLVLTQPVELPLGHRMTRDEYSREELLELFSGLVDRHRLDVRFGARVSRAAASAEGGDIALATPLGDCRARSLVLAMGRRGTPRRLEVPGEELAKVRYQLKDAASFRDRRILVVGGGDSAVEAAVTLARQPGNEVVLSYRRERFARIKRKNELALDEAVANGLRLVLGSEVKGIESDAVTLEVAGGEARFRNDDVFVLIGGEPPLGLLRGLGVRFGGDQVSFT